MGFLCFFSFLFIFGYRLKLPTCLVTNPAERGVIWYLGGAEMDRYFYTKQVAKYVLQGIHPTRYWPHTGAEPQMLIIIIIPLARHALTRCYLICCVTIVVVVLAGVPRTVTITFGRGGCLMAGSDGTDFIVG